MKLNIRKLNKKDLVIIKEWWKSWPKWVAPADDFLPNTGVVVESNSKIVLAGFIYLPYSKLALLSLIIADPEEREKDRKEILELLIKGSENTVKELGYKYMFRGCRNKHLIDKHKKVGWVADESPSHELVKILNE